MGKVDFKIFCVKMPTSLSGLWNTFVLHYNTTTINNNNNNNTFIYM